MPYYSILSVSEAATLLIVHQKRKEVKSTENKDHEYHRERPPFTVTGILGVRFNVKCPVCGAICARFIEREKFELEAHGFLCCYCHKWLPVKLADLKEELRGLIQQ